jgi:hypothetical protein
MSRPSPLAIAIAACAARQRLDSWVYADEIRHYLIALGFPQTTSAQQVAAWAQPMCSCDAPWLERERDYNGIWRYRLTRFGLNDIDNKLKHVRVYR